MKTKAVRLYGANDLRLEEFELPQIRENEVLMRVVTDSLCASTYKAVKQGTAHKRVPSDIAEHPVIIGHEFCGKIVEVGAKWKDKYKAGDKYSTNADLTLYAVWKADTYTVTYNANGGTSAKTSDTATYDINFTLTTAQRTGYEFVCWEYNGKEFTSGKWNLTKDITLVAE